MSGLDLHVAFTAGITEKLKWLLIAVATAGLTAAPSLDSLGSPAPQQYRVATLAEPADVLGSPAREQYQAAPIG